MLKIKKIEISDYKYTDNTISIEYEGKPKDSNQFITDLLELVKKTPSVLDKGENYGK